VPLAVPQAFGPHRASLAQDGKPVEFAQTDIMLIGQDPVERLAGRRSGCSGKPGRSSWPALTCAARWFW
jgi:hypothetical protein